MSTKTCVTCKELKPLCDFYPHKENKDGRRGDCIICNNKKAVEYHKKRYATDSEYKHKCIEYSKKYSHEHRDSINEKLKERYHSDGEYRQRILDGCKKYETERNDNFKNLSDSDQLSAMDEFMAKERKKLSEGL